MTIQELQQAFNHNYMLGDNFRTFTNANDDLMTATLDKGMFGKDYSFDVKIEDDDDTNHYRMGADELIDKINNEGWAMDALTADQVADEIANDTCNVPMYSVEPTTYTTRNGYEMQMFLLTFSRTLTADEKKAIDEEVRDLRGWYDYKKGGYMMRKQSDIDELTTKMLVWGMI